MLNPAFELHARLDAWAVPPGQSVENARGNGQVTARVFWRAHRDAVELLAQIETELTAMESSGDDVEVFWGYLPSWYEGVFAHSEGFRPGLASGASMLSADSSAMLRSLGLLISKVGLSSAGSPSQRASLLECIEQASALLETELSDWDRSEKEYLFRILESARSALTESAVLGSFDLRSSINELIGAMTGIALDIRIAEGGDSPRFHRFMEWVGHTSTVLRGIVYDAAALATITAAAFDVTKQITSG